jgi:branched-chain amino acid transport system substrate-binding protein
MISRRTVLAAAPAGVELALGAFASAPPRQNSPAAVTIGIINDMSGSYADLGGPGSVLATQMAIEDLGGSVLGQPIRILTADHKNKPDLAVDLVGNWLDRSGVTVIADGGASGAGLAIQQVTRAKKRIFLATGPATSDLTGAACSPYGFHWTYDTYALAQGTASTLVARGGSTWYFITADYAFGHSVQRDTTKMVTGAGGKVLGGVLTPIGSTDFSSYLLQAQSSGAQVIALALGGGDLVNAVKQAVEFGLTKSGQVLAGLLTFNTDVNAMGLQAAQGLVVTTSYDWELNSDMHAFAERFMVRNSGKPPSMVQAGTYSGVAHYIKAVRAVGSTDADAVAAQMRATRLDDFMSKGAWIRADGLVMRTMYVLAVKSPAESKRPWDYFSELAAIPPEKAFAPLNPVACKVLSKG